MADDIVEHLPAVDILEHHVVMMLMRDHLAHAADIGMIEQLRKGGFADRANLFGGIFCRLFGNSFGIW